MRILLVEDADMNANILAEFLTKSGHEVRVVGNAAEAGKQFAARDYDAAVIDYFLPDHDGLSLLDFLRKNHPSERWVPAVVITAASDDITKGLSDRVEALQPATVLQKPFEPEELINRIELVCRPRRKPS